MIVYFCCTFVVLCSNKEQQKHCVRRDLNLNGCKLLQIRTKLYSFSIFSFFVLDLCFCLCYNILVNLHYLEGFTIMKKCSHCGGSDLRKIDLPFNGEGFSVGSYICNKYLRYNLEVFVCMDCAHIEWFANELVAILKENDSEISQLNAELKVLQAKHFEAKNKLSAVIGKIAEVEKKSKSLDITIREQQDLMDSIATLKRERDGVQREIRIAERSICSLQSKLNTFK